MIKIATIVPDRNRRSQLLNRNPVFGRIVTVAISTLLVACVGKPDDIATMRAALHEQIQLEPMVPTGSVTAIAQGTDFNATVRSAVLQNPSYRAAGNAVSAAIARVGVIEGNRRPQLSGNLNAGIIQDSFSDGADAEAGAVVGINMTQLIYDGGENTADVNRVTAEVLIAEFDQTLKANDIALQAAHAWIDVWQYQSRLDLLRSRLSELNLLASQLERMSSNGMVDRTFVDNASRERLEFAMVEANLEAQLRDAELRFYGLFQTDPGRLQMPSNVITASQVKSEIAGLQQSPQVMRSVAEWVAAQSAVTLAESQFQPRVRMQSGLRLLFVTEN
jgi:outer membrane protein, adhesin transport system